MNVVKIQNGMLVYAGKKAKSRRYYQVSMERDGTPNLIPVNKDYGDKHLSRVVEAKTKSMATYTKRRVESAKASVHKKYQKTWCIRLMRFLKRIIGVK